MPDDASGTQPSQFWRDAAVAIGTTSVAVAASFVVLFFQNAQARDAAADERLAVYQGDLIRFRGALIDFAQHLDAISDADASTAEGETPPTRQSLAVVATGLRSLDEPGTDVLVSERLTDGDLSDTEGIVVCRERIGQAANSLLAVRTDGASWVKVNAAFVDLSRAPESNLDEQLDLLIKATREVEMAVSNVRTGDSEESVSCNGLMVREAPE